MSSFLGFTHEVNKARKDKNVECYTPRTVFSSLGLTFEMDVASPGLESTPWIPARSFVTQSVNGLITPWCGLIWMNHPYGWDDFKWARRFVAHGNGVALMHSRTDTRVQQFMMAESHVFSFTDGRIGFVDKNHQEIGHGPGCGQVFFGMGKQACEALARVVGQGTTRWKFGHTASQILYMHRSSHHERA